MLAIVLFELYCCFCVVGIPISVQYGFVGWLVQTAIGYVSVYVDWVCFDHFKKNMPILNKHGFSTSRVWWTMLFNLCATNALVGIIYNHCFNNVMGFSWFVPLQILFNLSITEVLFATSHMMLHYSPRCSSLHIMHHCCLHPSWSTNLIFHPLDLTAEFSGPVIAVLALHQWVWKDFMTLFLSVLILHLWYALDHSANLGLPHTKHHSQLNTVFTIYIRQRCSGKRKDLVRQVIKS